jgi:hypothetical protein
MCRMPIEPAGERLYDPRAKVEHALRRMKPCSVGDDGRGRASLRPQARTSGRFRHEQRRHVRPPPDDHPPGARAGARSCTSRCWPRSMTTGARAAADRGVRLERFWRLVAGDANWDRLEPGLRARMLAAPRRSSPSRPGRSRVIYRMRRRWRRPSPGASIELPAWSIRRASDDGSSFAAGSRVVTASTWPTGRSASRVR